MKNHTKPILERLAEYFNDSFDALPKDLQELVNKHFLAGWDSLSLAQRILEAGQIDDKLNVHAKAVSDAVFQLDWFRCFLGDLIKEAETNREHQAITALNKLKQSFDVIYANFSSAETTAKLNENTKGKKVKSDKLATLNQASQHWWGNADPKDEDTHPLNKDVVEWLEAREFSSTLANKGATIIRPEWAHTGRKSDK